jgi:hypothetical protein
MYNALKKMKEAVIVSAKTVSHTVLHPETPF